MTEVLPRGFEIGPNPLFCCWGSILWETENSCFITLKIERGAAEMGGEDRGHFPFSVRGL